MTLRIIYLLIIPITSFGQINQDALKLKVKATANEMGKVFQNGDHSKFIDFIYPKAVIKMGGREKFIKVMDDAKIRMEQSGIKVKSVEFEEPSDILEKDETLQCIITQVIALKVEGGTVQSKASLFALSEDNGQSWTFLDVSRKTLEQIKFIIPVFHSGLKIVKWPDPTFTPD